jgi:hypothetical protein
MAAQVVDGSSGGELGNHDGLQTGSITWANRNPLLMPLHLPAPSGMAASISWC